MSTVAGDGRSGMLPSLERRGGTWCSRSEEHTSELQSQSNLVCRLLLEKKKSTPDYHPCRPLEEPHDERRVRTASRRLHAQPSPRRRLRLRDLDVYAPPSPQQRDPQAG